MLFRFLDGYFPVFFFYIDNAAFGVQTEWSNFITFVVDNHQCIFFCKAVDLKGKSCRPHGAVEQQAVVHIYRNAIAGKAVPNLDGI